MGLSPVRLEAEVWRPASAFPAAARRTARSLPTLASRPLVDRRLRSLGGTRPLFHGSCWPCGMLQGPPNSLNHLRPLGRTPPQLTDRPSPLAISFTPERFRSAP